MALELTETEEGKVLEIRVSGKITHEDYAIFVPRTEALIRQHGKIRILMEMHDFHGWELSAVWDDIKFDLKHFNHIERLALVGETKWQEGMSKFCRPFTTAKIKYFDHSKTQDARQWVQEATVKAA